MSHNNALAVMPLKRNVSAKKEGVNVMTLFSGPVDIYEELVEKQPDDEEWLLGLVAFAVIEEQKIEWIKHQTENKISANCKSGQQAALFFALPYQSSIHI